jgi:hypothetical protein
VGGVDATIAVEQVGGGRDRGDQRPGSLGVGPVGFLEQLRHVAQVTGHVRAKVGGQGQPATPLPPARTQLSGAEQRGNGADGVAAAQGQVRGLLEQASDLLVGPNGRFGEMPGAALGTIREPLGQHRVDAAALVAGRQLHHRGPGQGMAEHQSTGAMVNLHQPRPFRRGQVLDPTLAGRSAPEHAKVAGAIQDREE